ncbi:MAG: 2-dehydro-3-deoxy-D-gluconate 5-dehydrogenase KduD [Chloroflexota bacterium]
MILDQFRLDGRIALVTGSSRGLGQAAAVALAEAGADIVVWDRSEVPETEKAVTALGRRFYAVQHDLQTVTVEDIRQEVAHIESEFGYINILVNNAGIIRRTEVLDFSEEDWDAVLQVDLKAVFFLSQAVAKSMVGRNDNGKIINIASMLSFQGGIRVPAYTAAKSGLAGITRSLANELATHNINVNAIAPGYMATDNTAALRADQVRSESILKRIPAGRWGTPDDLKGAVVFLASEAARYMHGAIVPVDGGWLAN